MCQNCHLEHVSMLAFSSNPLECILTELLAWQQTLLLDEWVNKLVTKVIAASSASFCEQPLSFFFLSSFSPCSDPITHTRSLRRRNCRLSWWSAGDGNAPKLSWDWVRLLVFTPIKLLQLHSSEDKLFLWEGNSAFEGSVWVRACMWVCARVWEGWHDTVHAAGPGSALQGQTALEDLFVKYAKFCAYRVFVSDFWVGRGSKRVISKHLLSFPGSRHITSQGVHRPAEGKMAPA